MHPAEKRADAETCGKHTVINGPKGCRMLKNGQSFTCESAGLLLEVLTLGFPNNFQVLAFLRYNDSTVVASRAEILHLFWAACTMK